MKTLFNNTLRVLIFSTFLNATAQKTIGDFVQLDTILRTGIVIDNENIAARDVKMKQVKGVLWLYLPNWKENDSLTFLNIDLTSLKQQTLSVYLPGISHKIMSPRIFDFDVNEHSLVLLFFNNCFAHLTKDGSGYAFDFIEPLQFTFNTTRLLPNDKLLIYNNYNSHPKSNPDKTIFHVYDLKQHKIVSSAKPHFSGIEFCHFAPNRWVDVNSEHIILAQTVSYALSFFDLNLLEKFRFEQHEENWLYADTMLVKGLESVLPPLTPKDFIEKLSPMEDSVSRIEAIYSLSDSKILVRKIPQHAKKQQRLRTYDVLTRSEKTGRWNISLHDLSDKLPEPAALCTKKNFPVQSVYNEGLFFDGYFVKLLPRFTPLQFGITHQQNQLNENEALGKRMPELYLQIFRTNFK